MKVDSGGKASRRLCSREGNSSALSTRCLINDLHFCRTRTHTRTQGSCQLSLSADGGLELPLQPSGFVLTPTVVALFHARLYYR